MENPLAQYLAQPTLSPKSLSLTLNNINTLLTLQELPPLPKQKGTAQQLTQTFGILESLLKIQGGLKEKISLLEEQYDKQRYHLKQALKQRELNRGEKEEKVYSYKEDWESQKRILDQKERAWNTLLLKKDREIQLLKEKCLKIQTEQNKNLDKQEKMNISSYMNKPNYINKVTDKQEEHQYFENLVYENESLRELIYGLVHRLGSITDPNIQKLDQEMLRLPFQFMKEKIETIYKQDIGWLESVLEINEIHKESTIRFQTATSGFHEDHLNVISPKHLQNRLEKFKNLSLDDHMLQSNGKSQLFESNLATPSQFENKQQEEFESELKKWELKFKVEKSP